MRQFINLTIIVIVIFAYVILFFWILIYTVIGCCKIIFWSLIFHWITLLSFTQSLICSYRTYFSEYNKLPFYYLFLFLNLSFFVFAHPSTYCWRGTIRYNLITHLDSRDPIFLFVQTLLLSFSKCFPQVTVFSAETSGIHIVLSSGT